MKQWAEPMVSTDRLQPMVELGLVTVLSGLWRLLLQVSLLGRGRGELLKLFARVGEGGSGASSRPRGETPPQTERPTVGARPIGRPAQESHAVWLPHRKDGRRPRKGLRQMYEIVQCVETSNHVSEKVQLQLIHAFTFKFLIGC